MGAEGSREDAGLPLCVDLDGTLLATDSLHELAIRLAAQRPFELLRLPFWLAAGRAGLKERLAARVALDPATLRYRPEVVALVRSARAAGRETFLVTAADRRTAEAIASHVGGFAGVLASDGARNLKGARKARLLCERFGRGAFEYLGDAAADLPVWEAAGAASLVAAPGGRLERRVRAGLAVRRQIVPVALPPERRLLGWLRALGPARIVASLFVLVPSAWSGAPLEPGLLVAACVAFAGAGAASGLAAQLLGRARSGPLPEDPPIAAAAGAAAGLAAGALAVGLVALPGAATAALLAFLALSGAAAVWARDAAGRAVAAALGVALRVAAGACLL